MNSSASQTDERYNGDTTSVNIEHYDVPMVEEEPKIMVGSPAMVMGRTYQAGSTLALSAKPRDSVSDISSASTNTERRILNNGLIIQAEQLYNREIGHAYGMVDDEGEQYSPVRPKNLSLCCH
jgi:hypothetical protein